MGRAKATLPIDDRDTFLTRIVRTFEAGVDDVVIVVGHERESIAAAFAASTLPARFVHNPDYDRGQLSSLIAGLSVVDRPGVIATLVTLVDVPLFCTDTVRTVVDCYRRTHAPIVRPTAGLVMVIRCSSIDRCSTRCGLRIPRLERSRSCEHMRRRAATSPSSTRAPSRTSILKRITGECSVVGRTAPVSIMSGVAMSFKAAELEVLVSAVGSHFGCSVALCDEPQPD
jgi:hypothetical protein